MTANSFTPARFARKVSIFLLPAGTGKVKTRALLAALMLAWALDLATPRPLWAQQSVRIGLGQSMFAGLPEAMVGLVKRPLANLIKEHTDLAPQLIIGGDAFDLGRKLHGGEVDLAIFQGIELAWVRNKYPQLQPLLVAVSNQGRQRANLVVGVGNVPGGMAGLKGKVLALPLQGKAHCRVFLEQQCQSTANCQLPLFFSQIKPFFDAEDALDEVASGKAQMTVVDQWILENYQANQPRQAKRLRVLRQSEDFPFSSVACRAGNLDEVTLRRFHTGMSNACNTPRGREMMSWIRIRAFQAVTVDYLQHLSEILKSYPPPAALAVGQK